MRRVLELLLKWCFRGGKHCGLHQWYITPSIKLYLETGYRWIDIKYNEKLEIVDGIQVNENNIGLELSFLCFFLSTWTSYETNREKIPMYSDVDPNQLQLFET